MSGVRHRPGLWLTTRGRERSWWLLVLAVCGAVPAAVVAEFTDAPRWLQGLVVVAGIGSGLLVAELRARRSQDDHAAAARRMHVAGAKDELPSVADVDPGYAGVHPALVDVGYVTRDADEKIARTLQERRRVLIVGTSMSGKTRTALHIAQVVFGSHRLLKPANGSALHHLLSQGLTPSSLVVWLDRLDLFLGSGGVTVDDLRAISENEQTVVIATIRLNAYEALLPQNGLQPVDYDVLEWFGHPVVLEWADDELTRSAVPMTAAVRDLARRYGLSAYIGGGPPALNAFDVAAIQRPVGHALVRAAADWRRAGVADPVPRQVLIDLLPSYLAPQSAAKASDTAGQDAGFEWATSKPADRLALLDPVPDGYLALDYVVDHVIAQRRAVPDMLWSLIPQHTPAEALVNVGLAAATSLANPHQAKAMWQQSQHPVALFNLGLLNFRRDDEPSQAAAEHLWRAAASAGDPVAMYGLSVLLRRDGAPNRTLEADLWSSRAAKATARRTFAPLTDPGHEPDADVRFSGAATDDLKVDLTSALRGYRQFLADCRIPLGQVPILHIDPTSQVAYPDPAMDRLFLGAAAAKYQGVVLHEYSHWMLEELIGVPRDSWTQDVQAIEAGLAYYLPCSHLGNPRSGFIDLTRGTALMQNNLDPSHQVGLRWATALWEIRQSLGKPVLDPLALACWRETIPTLDERTTFAHRLSYTAAQTSQPSARQIIDDVLARHRLATRPAQ